MGSAAGFKYLPNQEISKLSLNDFIICGDQGAAAVYNGKSGKEIYSFEALSEKAEELFKEYDSREKQDIIAFLNQMAGKQPAQVRELIRCTAIGMAALFSTLQKGTPESRAANDLTDADWRFWKSCSHIFLVGRLAQGKLGGWLEQEIRQCMSETANSRISVCCFQDPKVTTPSLLGCARAAEVSDDTVYVFDFGNTAVKAGRAVFRDETVTIEERPAALHPIQRQDNTLETAKQIHDEIVSSIVNTVAWFQEEREKLSVSLCLANNIVNGEIMDRGRYRSLRLLSSDYCEYLKEALEQTTGRHFSVHMMNDAQAVANLFREWSPNAAVVTLGTRMGIAYP